MKNTRGFAQFFLLITGAKKKHWYITQREQLFYVKMILLISFVL
jgi:hypothetical protein